MNILFSIILLFIIIIYLIKNFRK